MRMREKDARRAQLEELQAEAPLQSIPRRTFVEGVPGETPLVDGLEERP